MSDKKEYKKTCFVVMPITTPSNYLKTYSQDTEHFTHIFDCLLKPALNQAGYEAISPLTEGSKIIQADIIKNLERSDLVLVDLSTLNPNVLFELGVRTALNKPVCLIRDKHMEKIPFDIGSIHCPKYNPSLQAWDVSTHIATLTKHIEKTALGDLKNNALWKHFRFSSKGEPQEMATDKEHSAHKDLIIANLKLELSKKEENNLPPVQVSYYKVLKCMFCGFGIELTGEDVMDQRRGLQGLSGSSTYGLEKGIKCPNCGSIEFIPCAP